MSNLQWEMTEQTIVNRASEAHEQATFETSKFKKTKPGEKLEIDMNVVAEPMKEGPLLKKANISTNLPGWGSWEIICDEGTTGGGNDSAPSPLMYFSVGVAFCLLTHIQTAAKLLDIELETLRVEQRTTFSTTYAFGDMHPKDIFGAGEQLDTRVIIESAVPPEEMRDFVGWCEQACMAAQTVTNATPTTAHLYLNGDKLG